MRIFINKKECYGCGKCAIVCPTEAIEMMADEEGFLYPRIDENKCIHCGKCEKTCIVRAEKKKKLDIEDVYACSTKSELILQNSTSGGIFGELAQTILEEGGIVYGAAYENLEVVHVRVTELKDLTKLQGSKYVQSDIGKILGNLQADIEERKMVLFSGTACQVAAVRTLIGEKDNLLCVEIACMGCPSPAVWNRYVESCIRKYGPLKDIKFRDKATGWEFSSISYVSETGTKSFKHNIDSYMTAFGQALFLRPSCHDCKFKGKSSWADIKIGDFWGIQNWNEKYRESKGVSLVIPQTERGWKSFRDNANKLNVETVPYKFALCYNPYFELSKKPSKNRKAFFEAFTDKNEDIDEIISKCTYPLFDKKERYYYQYPVIENLLRMHVEGIDIADVFRKNGWNKVAIYGLGELGKLVVRDFVNAGIEITCLVDLNFQKFSKTYENIKVIGPHQLEEQEYDCIVVTLVHLYNSVLEVLLLQGVDLNKIISVGSID